MKCSVLCFFLMAGLTGCGLYQAHKQAATSWADAGRKFGALADSLGSNSTIVSTAATGTLHAAEHAVTVVAAATATSLRSLRPVSAAIAKRIDQSTYNSRERMQWLEDNLEPLFYTFAAAMVAVLAMKRDRQRRQTTTAAHSCPVTTKEKK